MVIYSIIFSIIQSITIRVDSLYLVHFFPFPHPIKFVLSLSSWVTSSTLSSCPSTVSLLVFKSQPEQDDPKEYLGSPFTSMYIPPTYMNIPQIPFQIWSPEVGKKRGLWPKHLLLLHVKSATLKNYSIKYFYQIRLQIMSVTHITVLHRFQWGFRYHKEHVW